MLKIVFKANLLIYFPLRDFPSLVCLVLEAVEFSSFKLPHLFTTVFIPASCIFLDFTTILLYHLLPPTWVNNVNRYGFCIQDNSVFGGMSSISFFSRYNRFDSYILLTWQHGPNIWKESWTVFHISCVSLLFDMEHTYKLIINILI